MRVLGNFVQGFIDLLVIVFANPGERRLQLVRHPIAFAGDKHQSFRVLLTRFLLAAHHGVGVGHPELRTERGIDANRHAVLIECRVILPCLPKNFAVGVVRIGLVGLELDVAFHQPGSFLEVAAERIGVGQFVDGSRVVGKQ